MNRYEKLLEWLHEIRQIQHVEASAEDTPENKVRSIKRLLINDFKYTHVPRHFELLENLEELDVRGISDRALFEQIGILPNLRIIKIGSTDVEDLPDNFFQLPKIEIIEYRGRIGHFSEKFGQLITLRELSIGDNAEPSFERIPDSLAELPLLETLRISGKSIDRIPESLAKIPNLKKLGIAGGCFLPENLHEMKRLESIHYEWWGERGEKHSNLEKKWRIRASKIQEIPNIKEVSIRGGLGNRVPFDLKTMPDLRSFSITDQVLDSFPEGIRELKSLEELQLCYTELTELPDWISELKELTYVNIQGCEINDISALFKLPRLAHVTLHENPIPEAQVRELKKQFPEAVVLF